MGERSGGLREDRRRLFLSTKNRSDENEWKGDYQHNHVNELREQPEKASEWSHDDASNKSNGLYR